VKVAEILQVPKEWTFIGHLCIGYPEEEADLPALQRQGWEERHPSTSVVIYR
jgi:5,6-dimethylbenzimidazole synthase